MRFVSPSLISFAAITTAALALAKTQSIFSQQVPTATIRNGSYYGTHSNTYSQDFFLGIPFAQPPLGALRFANPQSLNWTWSGALPATNYAYVSCSIILLDSSNQLKECIGYGGDQIGYQQVN